MHSLFIKITSILVLVGAVTTIQASETFSHTVLTLPDDPRNAEAWSMVINSQADWEAFFNQSMAYMTFLEGTAPTAPILDFDNYQVLTGGLGVHSAGGTLLVINKVHELAESIAVDVLLVRPSSNCLLPMVISFPSTTVLVKKTDKPFTFSVSQLINECAE